MRSGQIIHIDNRRNEPKFCAAVVIAHSQVVRTAPILRYMMGWDEERVLTYARAKGWQTLREEG